MDWFRYLELAIVGLVSSLFTHFLSNQRHVSQRWWERKAEVYTRILESLGKVREYEEASLRALGHEIELSDERRNALACDSQKGIRLVRDAMHLGTLLISRDAEQALRAATEEPPYDPQNLYGFLEDNLERTTKAILEVREAARTDLRVDGFLHRLWWMLTRTR